MTKVTETKWLSESKRNSNTLIPLKGLIIDESEKGVFIEFDQTKPAMWFPKVKLEQIKVTGDDIDCMCPRWLVYRRIKEDGTY